MEFTHEEIIKHLQSQKDKLNVTEMAKQIGMSSNYLTDAINEKEVKGRVRKIHKKHFPKIINYLNDIAIKQFVLQVTDETLAKL